MKKSEKIKEPTIVRGFSDDEPYEYAEGGGVEGEQITYVAEAIFNPNQKNGKIKLSTKGSQSLGGLKYLIADLNGEHIASVIFEANQKDGVVKTEFGDKTYGQLLAIIHHAKTNKLNFYEHKKMAKGGGVKYAKGSTISSSIKKGDFISVNKGISGFKDSPYYSNKKFEVVNVEKHPSDKGRFIVEYINSKGNIEKNHIDNVDKVEEYAKGSTVKGGSVRSLLSQFQKEKPIILIQMIADDVSSEFMRKKFDETIVWSKLSDSQKEKYNEDYRENKFEFIKYLIYEFLKLYYSNDTIKNKCKGKSRATISAIKSVMVSLAKDYPSSKMADGGMMAKGGDVKDNFDWSKMSFNERLILARESGLEKPSKIAITEIGLLKPNEISALKNSIRLRNEVYGDNTMMADGGMMAKGGKIDYSKQTANDFKLGEIVWDIDNKRYGTIIGIYDDYASSKYEVRLDTDGMQPTENLRKVGSKGDKGTKEKLGEEIKLYKRLIKNYPYNNYPQQIKKYEVGGMMAKGGEVKVGDVYERKGFGKLKITKIDDGKFRKVYFKYDDNDKEFFEGMYGAEGKIANKDWVKVNDKMADGGMMAKGGLLGGFNYSIGGL